MKTPSGLPPGLPDHFNPIFLTVLPKERRARHPYQMWIMIALIVIPLTQIALGLPNTASAQAIPADQAYAINWMCIICGLTGLYAAFIPERILMLFGLRFDATWTRLFIELAGQLLISTVLVSFVVTVFSAYPVFTRDGLATGGISLGGGLALFLAIAALHRSAQLIGTLWSVYKMSRKSGISTITGVDTLRQAGGG